MTEEEAKSAPPLLGRYRLLKEKKKSSSYRSFLAYDLKLKHGVIVKLISVRNFHKKYLPILWEEIEKTLRDEDNAAKVVELDFQKESLLVVEEYLEGRYFNSQIFTNHNEYEKFEIIMYRVVELIRRIHSRNAPHGFLDFTNMKVTSRNGIIIEDYPLLSLLENHQLLLSTSIPNNRYKQPVRDIRQIGLILFNIYRTQLVPEFGAFPEQYTRDVIYDFFKRTPFSHFSDMEKILGQLLLAGESKGYSDINEAFSEIRDKISSIPTPVFVREKQPQSTIEKTTIKPQTEESKGTSKSTQELAKKLGRPVQTPSQPKPIDVVKPKVIVEEEPTETKDDRPLEILTKNEIKSENRKLLGIAWLTVFAPLILFALIVLIVIQGFMATALPELTVPNLVGISFKEAEKKLAKIQLKIKISGEEYSEEMPKGMIIEHQPPENTRTKSGRTIYAVISKGLAVVTVPNLINLNETEAETNLKAFELTVGKKEYAFSEDVPLGTVIDQTPPANEKVGVGESVNLVISGGLLKKRMPMPDLTGMTLSEALNTIEQKKLKVRKIERIYSPYLERESISFFNPPVGEEIEYGAKVDITVMIPSSKAPSENFKIPVSIRLPEFDGQKRIRVTNRNMSSTKEIYNQLHNGREQISLLTDGVGRTIIQIYMDEELLREETF